MQGANIDRRGRIRFFAAAGLGALLLASTASAGNVTYTYDELGRITSATYPNGEVISYSYDPAGNRTLLSSNAANQPPTAVNDSISTPQNTAKTFDPRTNDTDPEGDPLTITAKTNGTKGVVALVGATSLTYTPNTGQSGADSFTYTISDGQNSSSGTVSVTITAPNQAPNAVNDSISTAYNTAKTFDPRTNDSDPDGNPLTITAKTNGASGTVAINSGASLTYTPNSGFSGADSFTYTISDGQGGADTATVSMTVAVPVNQPPTVVNDSITTNQGVNKTFDPRTNDSDPEGSALTITARTNGAKGTVTINAGTTLTYVPTIGASGSDSFTYTVADSQGATSSGTVSVLINRLPTAAADTITTPKNIAKTFDPRTNDSDPDGNALTISAKTNGTNGTVAIGAGGVSLTYTPAVNFAGADSFTYTISDGKGGTAVGNVSVTVTANTAPVAVNDAFGVYYTSTRTFDPRVNDTDADGDALAITSATSSGGATVTVAAGGGSFNYTPNITTGSDTVTYQISDGKGGVDTGQVAVTVRNTNTAPTATADTVTRQIGQPVTWDPRVNDSDPDGDPLTITAANTLATGVGTVTVNAGTSITFTPVPGSTQTAHFVVYTISDGAGGTAQSYTGIQAQ